MPQKLQWPLEDKVGTPCIRDSSVASTTMADNYCADADAL
jgi:hypothetical protein